MWPSLMTIRNQLVAIKQWIILVFLEVQFYFIQCSLTKLITFLKTFSMILSNIHLYMLLKNIPFLNFTTFFTMFSNNIPVITLKQLSWKPLLMCFNKILRQEKMFLLTGQICFKSYSSYLLTTSVNKKN